MQNQTSKYNTPELFEIELNRHFPFHMMKVPIHEKEIKALHIHAPFEIGLCLEGRGTFVIEDKVFSFQPGDVFLINHLEMHRACSPTGQTTQWYFMLFEPALLLGPMVTNHEAIDTEALCGPGFINRFAEHEFPEMHRLAKGIASEEMEKPPFYQDTVRLMLLRIMILACRELGKRIPRHQIQRTKRTSRLMARLKPALEKIARDYGEQVTVEDLAELCFMSTGHFRRQFHTVFGKSPQEYLCDFRINMVCNRLGTTSREIIQIAGDCGFPTLSCFNRLFKKKTGCSPREWRKGRE
jgi:AraC-like DNA-binding protein